MAPLSTSVSKVKPELRLEIQNVLLHQESLLQQYRSLLFTMQSLLFGAFVASFAGLAAIHGTTDKPTRFCFSSWATDSIQHSLFITLFVLSLTLVLVGLLVLSRMQQIIHVRGRNVSFCQRLLILDEIGTLADTWHTKLRLSNGCPIGMELALRLYEERGFPPIVSSLLGTVDFAAVREQLRLIRLSETSPCRLFFRLHIGLYFYALWFIAFLSIGLYALGSVIC
jgi:hypothetical protein